MPEEITQYQVLVASPSDCASDRELVINVLADWSETIGAEKNVRLKPLMWEWAAPESGVRAQGSLNRQLVGKADFLIALFWTRFGSDTGRAGSGTEEEILELMTSGRQAAIYFSGRPVNPEQVDPDQLKALKAFRERIQREAFTGSYQTQDELTDKLRRNLMDMITRPVDVRTATASQVVEYAVRASEDAGYDKIFEVDCAVEFYDRIAERYDARQSDDVLETHYSVIREVRSVLADHLDAAVLDLGGGTGIEIANHFAPRDNVWWWYIDDSREMFDRARFNLRRFVRPPTLIRGRVESQIPALIAQGAEYDCIIVSWLLSSVSEDLDWGALAQLLRPGGALVISDACPHSVAKRPIYGVRTDDGRVGLRLRVVEPIALARSLREAGLVPDSPIPIMRVDQSAEYGFVLRADSHR